MTTDDAVRARLAALGEDPELVLSLLPHFERAAGRLAVGHRWASAAEELTPTSFDRARFLEDLDAWQRIEVAVPGAVVVLREVDDLTDAQRRWLEVRSGVVACAEGTPLNTVAGALVGGLLDGLEGESAALTLRVEWLALCQQMPGRWEVAASLVIESEAGPFRTIARRRAPDDIALHRRPHVEAVERARAFAVDVVRAADGEAPPFSSLYPEALLDALMLGLIPDRAPHCRASWLLERGLALLAQGENGTVLELRAAGAHYTLSYHGLTGFDGIYSGSGKLTARITQSEPGGDIVDIAEMELFIQSLEASDFDAPAPIDDTPAREAATHWREAARGYLEELVPAAPIQLLTDSSWGGELYQLPFVLMRLWQVEGRPDSMPAEPVWLEVGPDRLDEIARRVRRLSDQELERFRARHPWVVLGICIDDWTVLFAPYHHRDGASTFTHDAILLAHDGVEAEILRNDPWNPETLMAIDGHGPLLRTVANSLRGLLERAGIDAEFRLASADDEEYDEDGDDAYADDAGPSAGTTTIRAWLDLEARSGPVPPFPLLDPRMHMSRIIETPFWANTIFGLDPAARSVHRAQITTHYYRFLRDVLDPSFPRAPLPPTAND